MRYVVGSMMVVFFLAGAGLFAAGVRGLFRRFEARRRLRRVEGEIVRIEKRQKCTDYDMGRTAEYDYPVIKFRPEWEAETTFTSEIGAGARCKRYAVGQKIGVLYDPVGEIPPMIDSWAGIWGPTVVQTIAGPVFWGAAYLLGVWGQDSGAVGCDMSEETFAPAGVEYGGMATRQVART